MFVGGAIAAIVIAYFAVLFFVQRSLLYPIPARQPDLSYHRVDTVRLMISGFQTYGLFLSANDTSRPSPLIIFSHGNGELAADWLNDFAAVREWSSALLVEYPGYGGAGGAPAESSIRETMLAAYDWASADARVDRSKIVIYGRSLGGGAAARLAADRNPAALILESSFTSVADFAARFLAPRILVRDVFDNREALRSYRRPVLFIHGTRDNTVPIEHARELVRLAPGAQLHEIECGHNDCPRQWPVIRAFLVNAGVLP